MNVSYIDISYIDINIEIYSAMPFAKPLAMPFAKPLSQSLVSQMIRRAAAARHGTFLCERLCESSFEKA